MSSVQDSFFEQVFFPPPLPDEEDTNAPPTPTSTALALLAQLDAETVRTLRLVSVNICHHLDAHIAVMFPSIHVPLHAALARLTRRSISMLEGLHRKTPVASLVFTFPHSDTTTIPQPALHPSDPERVYTLHPVPPTILPDHTTGCLVESYRDFPDLGPLWRAATDTDAFIKLLRTLDTLDTLTVRTPDSRFSSGLKRSIVDEALISVKSALESRKAAPAALLTRLVLHVHAAALHVMNPYMSWQGLNVRSDRAWWLQLRTLEVRVWAGSLRLMHDWEREVVERAWAQLLDSCSDRLVSLCLEVLEEEEEADDDHTAVPGFLRCPVIEHQQLEFNRLKHCELRGFEMLWKDDEDGEAGLRGFLNVRAGRIETLLLRGVALVGDDGEVAWSEVFNEWALQVEETQRDGDMRLKRKKKIIWPEDLDEHGQMKEEKEKEKENS